MNVYSMHIHKLKQQQNSRLDRILGFLLGLQFGVKGVSSLHNRLVLVLPVKTSHDKADTKANRDIGDDFSS